MTITNEAEAWLVLAELIEGAEALPAGMGVLFPDGVPGLCSVIAVGYCLGIFSDAARMAMHNRILRALEPRKKWLCPPHEWRPRVAWCRRFARDAARKGKP